MSKLLAAVYMLTISMPAVSVAQTSDDPPLSGLNWKIVSGIALQGGVDNAIEIPGSAGASTCMLTSMEMSGIPAKCRIFYNPEKKERHYLTGPRGMQKCEATCIVTETVR
jgi:hypothetical protein